MLRPSSGELLKFSAATTSSNPNPGNTKCSHNVAQQSARVDFNASLPNCTSFVKHHCNARSCGHPFNRHHGPWSLACKRPPQARRPRQAQGCRKAEIPPRTVLNKMVSELTYKLMSGRAPSYTFHACLAPINDVTNTSVRWPFNCPYFAADAKTRENRQEARNTEKAWHSFLCCEPVLEIGLLINSKSSGSHS